MRFFGDGPIPSLWPREPKMWFFARNPPNQSPVKRRAGRRVVPVSITRRTRGPNLMLRVVAGVAGRVRGFLRVFFFMGVSSLVEEEEESLEEGGSLVVVFGELPCGVGSGRDSSLSVSAWMSKSSSPVLERSSLAFWRFSLRSSLRAALPSEPLAMVRN